jgi:nitrate reductase molybdenum cofactor assembly chaperone NarJ/NarW
MGAATTTHQELCRHFAALLGYPQGDLGGAARACHTLLAGQNRSAAAELERFCVFLATQPAARVEEVYTATFDLQPVCHPYVGFQLFGESKERALFLVKLQECYRTHGYLTGGELPDHLSEVLSFLAMATDATARQELVEDGLVPALAKIVQGLEAAQHPYGDVLRALQDFLAGAAETAGAALAAGGAKELTP